MGIVIFSGLIVGVGSAVFLFGAQIVTFYKFATIICCTVSVSFLVAMILFGAIMHICGPKEDDDIYTN